MTTRSLFLVFLLTAVGLVVTGCEVETTDQPPLSYPPANHLVINEVYTLPVSNPNAHSWLELFNPTQQRISLKGWTLSYKTERYANMVLVFYDSSLALTFSSFIFRVDTGATYDVPIIGSDSIRVRLAGTTTYVGAVPNPFAANARLNPNEFFTIVSNLDRLRVFNTIGPGNGPSPESTPFLPINQASYFDYALVLRDTVNPRVDQPDTVLGYTYSFYLRQSDQIVLKDSLGRKVDVLRYGGYAYPGPGNDPYPEYKSIGTVPDFESVARYAGAYDSGNSATDFYITRPGLRPIPHWLSQLYKK